MRILLVEDDPAQLEPLQAALTHAGHVVDAAEDGPTARWLMGEKDYDLFIFDWMLPGVPWTFGEPWTSGRHGNPHLRNRRPSLNCPASIFPLA